MANFIFISEDLRNGECKQIGILNTDYFVPMIGDTIRYNGNKYKVQEREISYNYDGEHESFFLVVEKLY